MKLNELDEMIKYIHHFRPLARWLADWVVDP